MDGLFSDEELFLTQNSFSEERVEDNFSIAILTVYKQVFWYLNFASRRTKEVFVLTANKHLVGTLMTIGDVTVSIAIDSILDGLVACDEPVSQNSCKEELKQVVTEKSIKDGRTDPSNYPEAVRRIVIVDDEELEKRKECRIPPNTRINTSWAVRASSEWALERNGMIASTFADDIIVVNLGGNFSSRRIWFSQEEQGSFE